MKWAREICSAISTYNVAADGKILLKFDTWCVMGPKAMALPKLPKSIFDQIQS